MENEPEPQSLTETQKTQLKALEKKLFRRSMKTGARNSVLLVLASVVIGVLNAKYFQSQAFLLAGAFANIVLFFRQIRLDFLEENRIMAEELEKIFS